MYLEKIGLFVFTLIVLTVGQSVEIEGDGTQGSVILQGKNIAPHAYDRVGVMGDAPLFGIEAKGGYIGVLGKSIMEGEGTRTGVKGYASGGISNNVGVYGTATGTDAWAGYFVGNVYASSYTPSPSDRNFKHSIKSADNCLAKVLRLEPKTYDFRVEDYPDEKFSRKKQMGLIAQDVEREFPGVVEKFRAKKQKNAVKSKKGVSKKEDLKENSEDYLAMDYTKLVPALLGAMQEQQKQIEKLKKLIEK